MKFFYILFLCSIFPVYTMDLTKRDTIIESDSNEEISIIMESENSSFTDKDQDYSPLTNKYKDDAYFLNIFSKINDNDKGLIKKFLKKNGHDDISIKDITLFKDELERYYTHQNNEFKEKTKEKILTQEREVENCGKITYTFLTLPIVGGYATGIGLLAKVSYLAGSILCGGSTVLLITPMIIMCCRSNGRNKRLLKKDIRMHMIYNALEYLKKGNS